jgi:rhodanese-related sulfurtransferase
LGALLYSVTYLAIGYVSRDFLAVTLKSFREAGRAMEYTIVGVLIVYAIYRVTQMMKYRKYNIVPRVQAEQLSTLIGSPEAAHVQIVDVRSHGYYDVGAERILGSTRIEPNNLDEEIKHLPKDRDIYVYCTCARDATSAKVAHMLRERGFNAFVIVGGLTAWRKAGGHFESVPKSDLVKLPTFA